jgi:mRNA interferase YafQ
MKIKYELVMTASFRRALKKIKKRGYDISLLKAVVTKLQCGEPLEPKYNDHPLKGNKQGYRDCHILNDWVLIYQIAEDRLILSLLDTGTHSDLDL